MDERRHVAEPNPLDLPVPNGRRDRESSGRDVDPELDLGPARRKEPLLDRVGGERDRSVAARGAEARVVEEEHTQVAALGDRVGDEAAVHVSVAARLVDEQRPDVVEVLLRVPALVEDRRARDRVHRSGDDPERLAGGVVVDGRDNASSLGHAAILGLTIAASAPESMGFGRALFKHARRSYASAAYGGGDAVRPSRLTRMRALRGAPLALAIALVLLPAATASHTPAPANVTIAGSLQSELGCAGDWQPDCAATHLTYDAADGVWQRAFALPAGSYEYKAALNDSWDENYGRHALPDGANVPLELPAAATVKFYYDHATHWVTDNRVSVIAVAPGSFQSELGCPGDWDPGCLRSWLQDVDGDGIYSFETTALPQGSYDAKVAINESWDENYGAGGVPNGPNIAFSVPTDNAKATFTYDAATHVVRIAVESAPGAPGALSHFDLARKDCLGTARNTGSKVWYTVANGVLSDVYYPTVDNTNVETLQYVVTDGSTFTDLQTRDMTYTVEPLHEPGEMACRVTATGPNGRYRIRTDYITDPARNTVLMRVEFKPKNSSYRLYVRFDPTVNGNGGGGAGNGGADSAAIDDSTGHLVLVASDPVTATQAANRDYAQPVYAALDGSFDEATSGFAGAGSDGLVQLDASHALTKTWEQALGGNVVQTARVQLIDGKTVLALGFGSDQTEAVGAAEGSLGAGFEPTLADYRHGWKRYDHGLTKPRTEKLKGLEHKDEKALEDTYYLSANVLKASEDKTFAGAIVASLASPWGQAISAGDPTNTYFGS